MVKITFQHPPTKTANPFNDFEPWYPKHYPTGAGIYIYGLKLNIDNADKFIPLAVGESGNLKKRLFEEHYHELKMNGNKTKEIFDWELVDSSNLAKNLYEEMGKYDTISHAKAELKKLIKGCPNLIWFNNPSFFDLKLGAIPGTSKYVDNTGPMHSIGIGGDLTTDTKSHALFTRIFVNKMLFNTRFYFIYIDSIISNEDIKIPLSPDFTILKNKTLEKDKLKEEEAKIRKNAEANRKYIEHKVKEGLSEIGIYTTAKSKEPTDHISNELTPPIELEIDLSAIQGQLICLPPDPGTSSVYGYPEYTKPLKL